MGILVPRYPQYLGTAKAVILLVGKKNDSEKKNAGGTIKFWLLRNMGQKRVVLVENPRIFVKDPRDAHRQFTECFPKLDAFKARIRNFWARMNINQQDLKQHLQTSLE